MRDPVTPEEIPARYPLSTQQAICLEEENTSGFILPFAMRVKGQLDLDALQGALNDVVVRHEILRTSINGGGEGEAPYQTIQPPVSVPFTVHDLDPEPGRSRDEIADELLVKFPNFTEELSAAGVPTGDLGEMR